MIFLAKDRVSHDADLRARLPRGVFSLLPTPRGFLLRCFYCMMCVSYLEATHAVEKWLR